MPEQQPQHLDVTADIKAIDALLNVGGLKLVDVGCGPGALSKAMAERGATVVAIEPDPKQAALNAAADPVPGVTFLDAPAQSIPVETATMDGVVFSRSLHHVPGTEMDTALREAERVLKSESGFMFVLEPEVNGTYFQLIKPFHDETEVRRLAREALVRVADQDFAACATYTYETMSEFAGFEEFRDRVAARTFLEIDVASIDRPEIRRTFETGYDGETYRFAAPHWIALYRGVRR